jgi:hypothetical protein
MGRHADRGLEGGAQASVGLVTVLDHPRRVIVGQRLDDRWQRPATQRVHVKADHGLARNAQRLGHLLV